MAKFFSGYYGNLSRHYFEHIHEDRPVRLYLDLEFPKELNKEFEWEKFWPAFKQLLAGVYKCFCEGLGENPPAPPLYLVLDSSTTEKFSKHVIGQSDTLL